MSETTDQIALFKFLATVEGRYPLLAWVFHPANEANAGGPTKRIRGGKLVPIEAAQNAQMGVKKGVPDILFAQPFYDPATNTQYAGIAIELKTATGRVRPEQDAWLKQLQRAGWFCAVCREWTDAARLLIKWVGGDPSQEGL